MMERYIFNIYEQLLKQPIENVTSEQLDELNFYSFSETDSLFDNVSHN